MKRLHTYVLLALVMLQLALPVLAGETGPSMPWNQPLETMLKNLSGPTAGTLLLIAFVIAAFGWAFFSDNRWLYRAGISILILAAVASISTVVTSFGLDGACL
jgi:type IV secretory pathway VirB2 component (pilin)